MAEKYTSTAKVIDGVLILSLPDAITPVVWQMELGQSKSSALEIRDIEEGKFLLTLKTPRQDVLDIATYSNRDQAIKALLMVSQAMEKAQGQLKYAAKPNSYPVPAISRSKDDSVICSVFCILTRILKFSGILLASLILIGLVVYVGSRLFFSSPVATNADISGNNPVSADEFLEGR